MSGVQRFLVSRQISDPSVKLNKVYAVGGTIVEQFAYRFHYFTTPGDYIITFGLIGSFDVFIWGAGGGGGTVGGWSFGAPGGGGGFATGTITNAKESYIIKVGGGGTANGLGYSIGYGGPAKPDNSDNRYSGQGGGLSGIFDGASFTPSSALLIAGGGGGGGASRAGTGNQGGAGGGTTAQDGVAAYDGQTARRGRGGGQTGPTTLPIDGNSSIPTQFNGGVCINYGGGGGGGWWGGSAGNYAESNTMAGGGGGSGYFNPSSVINTTLVTGNLQSAASNTHPYWSNYGTGANVASTGNNGAVIIRYPL